MNRSSDLRYVYKDLEKTLWFQDLLKLSEDEVKRIHERIKKRYEFAKNAWYIPLAGDKRCPIMVAKDIQVPSSIDKMIYFQDYSKTLENQYKSFIDAWDNNKISLLEIDKAIRWITHGKSWVIHIKATIQTIL